LAHQLHLRVNQNEARKPSKAHFKAKGGSKQIPSGSSRRVILQTFYTFD
jgi:hypothetical protein